MKPDQELHAEREPQASQDWFILYCGYAVSLTTFPVQPHIYATYNKLHVKMCSSNHCS